LKDADRDINLFDDFQFAQFHSAIDGELRRLNCTGEYIYQKKASVITVKVEEVLWRNGFLVLSDTMVYLTGWLLL